MKLWEKFEELNSGDQRPEKTKFMTFYVFPLVIIGLAYYYWHMGQKFTPSLLYYYYAKTEVDNFYLREKSNEKLIETIYTDLYLNTIEGYPLYKKGLSENATRLIKDDFSEGDEIEVYFDDYTGDIKELRSKGVTIISYEAELSTNRRSRIVVAVLFFGFLFWYIFRMYRYRKHGRI